MPDQVNYAKVIAPARNPIHRFSMSTAITSQLASRVNLQGPAPGRQPHKVAPAYRQGQIKNSSSGFELAAGAYGIVLRWVGSPARVATFIFCFDFNRCGARLNRQNRYQTQEAFGGEVDGRGCLNDPETAPENLPVRSADRW